MSFEIELRNPDIPPGFFYWGELEVMGFIRWIGGGGLGEIGLKFANEGRYRNTKKFVKALRAKLKRGEIPPYALVASKSLLRILKNGFSDETILMVE
jgi:hypothetical protein